MKLTLNHDGKTIADIFNIPAGRVDELIRKVGDALKEEDGYLISKIVEAVTIVCDNDNEAAVMLLWVGDNIVPTAPSSSEQQKS